MADSEVRTELIPVWDIVVRVFHWMLVIGFFIAYLSEGEPLWLHVWAGYLVASVVLLRIFWGFIGSKHARFTDFVFPLGRIFSHLFDELRFRARRFVGHSPAGGAMVLALLAVLLLTTASGVVLLAREEGSGPFSSFIVKAPVAAQQISRSDGARLEVEEGEAEDSTWEKIHEVLANIALVLVMLHIGGVLLASVGHRENLIASMIHGRKRAE